MQLQFFPCAQFLSVFQKVIWHGQPKSVQIIFITRDARITAIHYSQLTIMLFPKTENSIQKTGSILSHNNGNTRGGGNSGSKIRWKWCLRMQCTAGRERKWCRNCKLDKIVHLFIGARERVSKRRNEWNACNCQTMQIMWIPEGPILKWTISIFSFFVANTNLQLGMH